MVVTRDMPEGMTSEAIRARHERCGECSECDRHRDVEALLVRVKDLENAIANARMLIKVGVGGNTYITMEPMKCGKYIGDNDATCPQLTCIREREHDGLCDNVNGGMRRQHCARRRTRCWTDLTRWQLRTWLGTSEVIAARQARMAERSTATLRRWCSLSLSARRRKRSSQTSCEQKCADPARFLRGDEDEDGRLVHRDDGGVQRLRHPRLVRGAQGLLVDLALKRWLSGHSDDGNFGYDSGQSDQDFLASLRADGYVADEKLNPIHLADYSTPETDPAKDEVDEPAAAAPTQPVRESDRAWKNLDSVCRPTA